MSGVLASKLAHEKSTVQRDFLIILSLSILCAALPRILVFPLSVIHWDESIYTLVARDLARGQMPFSGIFDHKPILIYVFYAIPQLVLGEIVSATRVVSVLVGVVGAVTFGYFVRTVITQDIRIVAAGAAMYGLLSSLNRGMAAHPELFMNIFMMLVWIVMQRQQNSANAPLRFLILIGALWAFSFQTNYLTGFLLVAFALDYLYVTLNTYARRDALIHYVTHGVIIFAAFAAVCAALVLPILVWGDIGTYFTLQAKFLSGYAKEGDMLRSLLDLPKVVRAYFILIVPMIACLAFLAYSWLSRGGRNSFADNPIIVRMAIYFLVTMVAAVASNRIHEKYYLLILPSTLAVLCYALTFIPTKHAIRGFFCAWLALFAAAQLEQERVMFKQGLVGFVRWAQGQPVDAPDKIARDLRAALAPGETIYVYDYQHILYYQTGVVPPTAFAFSLHHLEENYTIPLELAPQPTMTGILEKTPRFVVAGSDPAEERFGLASKILADRLASDYRLVATYTDTVFQKTVASHGNGGTNWGERSGDILVFEFVGEGAGGA